MLQRTRFGRYMYAIGGNPEATRSAGVSLAAIRIWAFALCSATAAFGGILLGSFFYGEYSSNTADPGQLVLYTVAAAVIGGVSLFGGRGKAVHGSSAASSSAASPTACPCSVWVRCPRRCNTSCRAACSSSQC